MKLNNYLDLLFAVTVALLALFIALAGFRASGEFQTLPVWFMPFGVLLTLFLPGYSLAINISPTPGRSTILLLSISMSMGLAFLGSMVLNLTSEGLVPRLWVLWLSGITIMGCVFAAFHRYWKTETPLEHVLVHGLSFNRKQILMFALAFTIMLGAFWINLLSVKYYQGAAFTQIWALPVKDNLQPYTLEIGIKNWERAPKVYNLYIESRGRKIESWQAIFIPDSGSWTTRVEIEKRPTSPIFVYLYLADAPDEIYRTIKISPQAFTSLTATDDFHTAVDMYSNVGISGE